MSAYLNRLKLLETESNSHYAPKSEPSKGSEWASEGFEGTHTARIEKKYIATDQWREFERLLAIVIPAHPMSIHEYAELRECARGDLANAITCYRSMAAEMKRKSIATGGE